MGAWLHVWKLRSTQHDHEIPQKLDRTFSELDDLYHHDIVVTGGKVARSFTPERDIFVAGPVVIERVEGSRQLNSLRILLG